MSMTEVRSYFRDRMNELGFKEHKDAFGLEIGSTKIHKAYHIESGDISELQQNHGCAMFVYPLTVRFYLKGYRYPADAIDESIDFEQTIAKNCKSPATLAETTIRRVSLPSSSREPHSESNDNIVMTTMGFVAEVVLEII